MSVKAKILQRRKWNATQNNNSTSTKNDVDVVDMPVQRAQNTHGELSSNRNDRDIVQAAASCSRKRDVVTVSENNVAILSYSAEFSDNIDALQETSLGEKSSLVKGESVRLDTENGSMHQCPDIVVPAIKVERIEKYNCEENKTAASSHEYYQTVDPFGVVDCLGCFFAIVGYLADVGSDIFVAVLYFNLRRWVWFGLTIGFVVIPALVTTSFSIAWYIQDNEYYKSRGIYISIRKWLCRVIFHLLQIGPVLRYIDIIRYGVKSRLSKEKDSVDRRHYVEIMLNEDADTALLRLLECFMEAAPQLTLQLYILCRYSSDEALIIRVGQGLSCVTSLTSLSWALTSYHKSLRLSLQDKAKLSYKGMALQFLWRFFTIGCRVLAFALFASQLTFWVFVVAGCHWFAMFIWMLLQKTSFCDITMKHAKCQEFFFNMVIAAVYVFCFVNVTEGHTRLRYLIYYCVVYIENLGMCLFWYMFAHTSSSWYLEPAMAVILGGFFVGILFQISYYLICHPNNYPPYSDDQRIKFCLSCDELLDKSSQSQAISESSVYKPVPSQIV